MDEQDQEFEQLLDAMKKAAGALREAEVPVLLGGGLACWARGAPKTEHDVDFLVRPADAERAQHVWNPAAGSVAPYRLPAVEPGVRRDESAALVREFLERFPQSPFVRWAQTLV